MATASVTIITTSATPASCFVDIATFSEPDSFIYGGPEAISWFVSGVQKTNWFSIVPVSVRHSGEFNFGGDNLTASLNRSGDYVLNSWFQCDIPHVQWLDGGTQLDTDRVRWTRNLMHNLIREVRLTFNDLEVHKFDNYWLDFYSAFHVDAGEMPQYKQMIGDISSMTTALTGNNQDPATDSCLPGGQFAVPLPFFYHGDPGISLPVSALPFNDVKIQYSFRDAADLLVLTGSANASLPNIVFRNPALSATTGLLANVTAQSSPRFLNGQTWATYAVVYQEERIMMGAAPRDMLITQNQIASIKSSTSSSTEVDQDLRFSHPVRGLYYAFRNRTYGSEWSNYTTNVNYGVSGYTTSTPQGPGPSYSAWNDPVGATNLKYENTDRVKADSIYTSLVSPYVRGSTMPTDKGYHSIFYSLNDSYTEGSGSTDYSRLNNVNNRAILSAVAQFQLSNGNLTDTTVVGQTPPGQVGAQLALDYVNVVQNWNIGRISGGTWSFINF